MTGPDAPHPVIRPAAPSELARLRWIEGESDRLYAEVAIGPFVEDEAENHLPSAAAVFAAGDPAVGFVCIELLDGCAHIDQLAVLPEHGRGGTGRALLERAIEWARESGLPAVTLTTFRDVPWNAPFYRSAGFEEVTDFLPGLAAARQHEREVGLDAHGPRVAMRRDV